MSANDTQDTQPSELIHDSELMNNYAVQMPAGAGNEFRTLMDARNRPLIFAIGTDDRLRLICETENKSLPWHLTSLTPDNVKVHSFAVAQNPETGEIRVAYATLDGGKSRLYYSMRRSHDRTALASDSPFQWREHRLDPDDVEVNKIEMDFEHMMFTCKRGIDAFYCLAGFSDDPQAADLPDQRLELPQFADEITDFKVGTYGPKRAKGMYLLCTSRTPTNGISQTLEFRGIPGSSGTTPTLRFGISGCLSSIALARNKERGDRLVAAGDSVRIYESFDKPKELIENRGTWFSGVQATEYGGYTSLWVIETIDGQPGLLFLTDRYFDDGQQSFSDAQQWTADLPFQEKVSQFSCIKGSPDGNHLILIDPENRLSHLYQDPLTTLWRRDAIAVEPIEDKVLEFPCYTTRLVLRAGEEGTPAVGEKYYVRASSQVRATINGAVYDLSHENPVCVETDIMGALTIIQPVDDIDTPLFYVGRDREQPSHVIDPAHHVEERLREIQSAQKFKMARTDEKLSAHTDETKSLWQGTEPPSDDNLNAAATIIQRLLDTRQGLMEDERAKLPGAGPAPERPDSVWGAQFGADGSITYLASEHVGMMSAEAPRQGFHPFKWVGHSIGTVIHGIHSLGKKAWSFVVRQVDRVTTFILNLAGEIIHVVIDTLEKVFPFLKVIFNAIGLVFKTLLHWLGRLLGWNDIWATHKMIARLTRNGTRSLRVHVKQSVPAWQADVDRYVKHLQEELARITDKDLPDDTKKKKTRVLGIFSDLLASPLFTWPMYMLLHSGIVMKEVYLLTIGRIQALDDFVEQQAAIHKEVVTFVERELGAILAFAASPDFSTRGLLRLFRPLLDEVLKTLGALLQGLLGFLAEAMEKLEELFGDSTKIPFVGPMYKFVTELAGEKEEYNFLNSFSLMVSVPFTIFYKIFSGGGKPFDGEPEGFGEPEMFDEFWKPRAPQSARRGEAADGAGVGEEPSKWDEIATGYQYIAGIVGCSVAILDSGVEFGRSLAKKEAFKKISLTLNAITHATTIPVATASSLDEPEKRVAFGMQEGQFILSVLSAIVLPCTKCGDKAKNVASMIMSVASLGTNITANVLVDPGIESWIGQMICRTGSLVSGAGAIAGDNFDVLATGAGLSGVGTAVELGACTAPGNWGTYN